MNYLSILPVIAVIYFVYFCFNHLHRSTLLAATVIDKPPPKTEYPARAKAWTAIKHLKLALFVASIHHPVGPFTLYKSVLLAQIASNAIIVGGRPREKKFDTCMSQLCDAGYVTYSPRTGTVVVLAATTGKFHSIRQRYRTISFASEADQLAAVSAELETQLKTSRPKNAKELREDVNYRSKQVVGLSQQSGVALTPSLQNLAATMSMSGNFPNASNGISSGQGSSSSPQEVDVEIAGEMNHLLCRLERLEKACDELERKYASLLALYNQLQMTWDAEDLILRRRHNEMDERLRSSSVLLQESRNRLKRVQDKLEAEVEENGRLWEEHELVKEQVSLRERAAARFTHEWEILKLPITSTAQAHYTFCQCL